MPIYVYACTNCGERTEAKQSFDDPPLEDCVPTAAASSGRCTRPWGSSSRVRASIRPMPSVAPAVPKQPEELRIGLRVREELQQLVREEVLDSSSTTKKTTTEGSPPDARDRKHRRLRRLWFLFVPGRRDRSEGVHAVRRSVGTAVDRNDRAGSRSRSSPVTAPTTASRRT